MPERSQQIQEQINTARSMPSGPGKGDNLADDTSEQSRAARAPAPAHPGAPAKLPGYGK